ncbi:hypothetical protein [Chachezhania sediminis]|uniref:hypothetical protein n=1 Tax=Chachezhania sediminis TaxID=2599291 RepID=UPI00131E492F|nr:hypothetical protein [Chachezhania sediminis]
MEKTLESIVFGFLQAAFWGERSPGVEPDFEAASVQLSANRTLRVETLAQWPDGAREGLRVLLTQWVIVLRIAAEDGNPLPSPSWLLDGSSSTRLGEPVLALFLERLGALEELHRDSLTVRKE